MSVLDGFSLAGKTALVTGGAGMYGRPIVAALAEAGARTFVASRNIEALESFAAQQRAAARDVTALPFDQGDEASVLALRDALLERAGGIDVLVNNAVARPLRDGYHSPAEDFAESMRINATGLFIATRCFGDVMAAQERGSIINIGSIMGMVGPEPTNYRGTSMHGWAPDYFFHKGGMISFTRFIAAYYGGKGVRCNCLSLGGLRTNQHPEDFVRQYSERTMLGRLAAEEDVMGAVVFLAGDTSRYVTGANIPVDGGYTAK